MNTNYSIGLSFLCCCLLFLTLSSISVVVISSLHLMQFGTGGVRGEYTKDGFVVSHVVSTINVGLPFFKFPVVVSLWHTAALGVGIFLVNFSLFSLITQARTVSLENKSVQAFGDSEERSNAAELFWDESNEGL